MALARASSWDRAAGGIIVVLALAAGLLTTGAPDARAATAPPWRFRSVEATFAVSEVQTPYDLACPSGYRPVWGGVVDGNINIRRYKEYLNLDANAYHVGLVNRVAGTHNVKIRVNCVWAADLGTIEKVTFNFPRHPSAGYGGGYVNCSLGYEVLSGGAEWSGSHLDRYLSYSAPVLDDGGRPVAWYAAGYNPTAGTELTVEAYCIEASYLAAAYATVEISSPSTGYNATAGVTATCAAGYRILTGGTYPWENPPTPAEYHGWGWIYGPTSPTQWRADAILPYQEQIRSVAICIPASAPSVTITQAPAELAKDRSGQISWTSSDQTGESLTAKCQLDGAPFNCPASGSYGYFGLDDGYHVFSLAVTNESGRSATAYTDWDIDATAPIVTGHAPAPTIGIGASLTITFSEQIAGAAKAIAVHGQETDTDVAGTVTRLSPIAVRWTPDHLLIPGETYRVSLTDAIRDVAGNRLIPTFFDIRAATTVQNSSPALVKTWDRDARPIATNDMSIVSRTKGSAASLTFTAIAGQVVSVYGIRLPIGGFADIHLDGVKKATPSFYAPTATRARVYASPPLSAGQHTVSVRPLGTAPAASSGTWVALDNLTVGAAVRQESSLRQTFARVSTTKASGGSYDVVTHVTDSDAAPAFSARFVGDGVKVYATKTPAAGKARVFIDGVLTRTVNLYAASAVFKALVYSTTLPQGAHRIRVEPVGTATGSGSAIGLDYLTVQ